MDSLEKSLELYGLMVDRLEESGHAPHQLEYYKECIRFIEPCGSLEEAQEKMRKSHLYTAGGEAAVLDDVLNRKWAAEERQAFELAELFAARYEELKANPAAAFNAADVMKFQQRVKELEIQFEGRKDSFLQIFQGYLELCAELPGTEEYGKAQIKIEGGMEKMDQLGKPFTTAVGEGAFRKLLAIPDTGYEMFAESVNKIMEGTFLPPEDGRSPEKGEWEEVKSLKREIMEVGRGEIARRKAGLCFCESPKDVHGKYTYEKCVEV